MLTGPIFVEGAEPGDLLKVTIQDLQPRVNPEGKTYGSNANAWWGFQARVPQADGTDFDAGDFTDTPGSNDEVITIYELASDDAGAPRRPKALRVDAEPRRWRRERPMESERHTERQRHEKTTQVPRGPAHDLRRADGPHAIFHRRIIRLDH